MPELPVYSPLYHDIITLLCVIYELHSAKRRAVAFAEVIWRKAKYLRAKLTLLTYYLETELI